MSAALWEEQAEAWARWRTRPDRHYKPFGDAILELIPPPPLRVLDLGCGEGSFTRELRAAGYDAVGVDASETLLALAAEDDPDGEYITGDVTQLPFEEASFAAATARLSLQDFDDLDAAVREVARVLAPSGKLCFSVFHPVAATGRATTADEDPVLSKQYFDDEPWVTQHDADGVPLTIHSNRRPLGSYVGALERASLVVEAVSEPRGEGRWARLPLVLGVRAAKRP